MGDQGPPGSLVRADVRLEKGPRVMTSEGSSRGLVGADARPRKVPRDCQETLSGLMTSEMTCAV